MLGTARTPGTRTTAFKAGISVMAVVLAAILLGLLLCCCCLPALAARRRRRRRSDPPSPPVMAAAVPLAAPRAAIAPPPVIAPTPMAAAAAPMFAAPFIVLGGANAARALAKRIAATPASRVGELAQPVAVNHSIVEQVNPHAQHCGQQLLPAQMVSAKDRNALPGVIVPSSHAQGIAGAVPTSYDERNLSPTNVVSGVNAPQYTWSPRSSTSTKERSPVTYI